MARSRVEVSGVESALDRIRQAKRRAANPNWDAVADVLDDETRKVWKSEGASTRRKWKMLTRDYEKRKRTMYPGKGTLVRTGSLQKSLTRGHRFHIDTRSNKRLVWGTKHPLAHLHHDGSRKGQVPSRVIVPSTDADLKRAVRNAMKRHIMGK